MSLWELFRDTISYIIMAQFIASDIYTCDKLVDNTNTLNPNSHWGVHMGISLKERQITEEPMKVKIWKKIANPQALSVE